MRDEEGGRAEGSERAHRDNYSKIRVSLFEKPGFICFENPDFNPDLRPRPPLGEKNVQKAVSLHCGLAFLHLWVVCEKIKLSYFSKGHQYTYYGIIGGGKGHGKDDKVREVV